jgi:hypothetical protein
VVSVRYRVVDICRPACDRPAACRRTAPCPVDRHDEVAHRRAGELGLSKSAYIRQLIEADLRAAYSGEPEMVPLDEVRAMISTAVGEVLETLTHRYGHAT